MREFLKSKKAKALILGLVAIVVTTIVDVVGLDLKPEQLQTVTLAVSALVAAYMASQGYADRGKEQNKSTWTHTVSKGEDDGNDAT